MSKKRDSSPEDVQREIRAQQKFSMTGAIGRAGSGLMKGASPVSQQEQAFTLLTQWIDQHIPDPAGAMKSILRRRVRGNDLLLARHLKQPSNALQEIIEAILASDYALQEFVRQIDVRWGELYQERPLFQSADQAPDPADEYTFESVRQDLVLLREKLRQSSSPKPDK